MQLEPELEFFESLEGKKGDGKGRKKKKDEDVSETGQFLYS
jgi:hypothetical protein